jgi:hypothetical protein
MSSAVTGTRLPVLRRPLDLERLAPWIALFLPLFIYNIGFRYVGSGDTAPAELLPIAILDGHGFDFREFISGDLPYWFRLERGRVVSSYPVLPGLLNVPVSAAARLGGIDLYARRQFLSMLTASAVTAFSVFFLYLALTHVCRSEREALFFSLAYAFGTTAWSIASRGAWQHGPSLLFLTIALWGLFRGGTTVPLAGLALGLAVVNRPTNALIALPLAIYVLRYERRRALPFAGLALLPAFFHLWYARIYWGTFWSLAQAVPRGNFDGHFRTGLAGILVSPSRGLFVFSPIFLFAIPGAIDSLAPAPRGQTRLPRYLAAGVLLTILLYARWSIWWGGHSFGYRLLTELAPLLIVLIAAAWPSLERIRGARLLFGILLAASLYFHFLGAMIYPSGFDNEIDTQPDRLWSVRNSELDLSTRKLLITLRRPGLAAALAPRQVPPPAAAWWRPDINDDTIPGAIDQPREGASAHGRLEISGWGRAPGGDVEVRIAIAPEGLAPPIGRTDRSDVQQATPGLGDCSRAGWEAFVEAPATEGEHVLRVELKAPDGRVRLLGPVRFRWGR